MCPASLDSLELGQVWRGGVCDEVLLVLRLVERPLRGWDCVDLRTLRRYVVSDSSTLESIRFVRLL